MAQDLVGPANAPNSVTARPGETRTFGVLDTWFKDCTSPTANDGTKIQAGWLNAVTATFRSLIRGNGLTALSAPVVDEDNADNMLLRAVQHLIQRGQPQFANDTGSANQVVLAVTPAAKEYKTGMVVVAKMAATNTGVSTLNVSGLGAQPIRHADGSDLTAGEMAVNTMVAFVWAGTVWQLAWAHKLPGPIFLAAPRTFYVNSTTGNDAWDGTSATFLSGQVGPFATLKRASDEINKYNLNGYSVTVNVANGTYTFCPLPNPGGSGSMSWIGNSAIPANCLVNSIDHSGFIANGGNHTLNGFKIQTSGNPLTFGDPMYGVAAAGGGTTVDLQNIDWGTCSGPHIFAQKSATLGMHGAHRIVGAVSGNAFTNKAWLQMTTNAQFVCDPGSLPSLNITTPVTYDIFIDASFAASVQLAFTSITGAGNVTGKKYSAIMNGMISSLGSGVNYFPGTIAGTTATGGQYA